MMVAVEEHKLCFWRGVSVEDEGMWGRLSDMRTFRGMQYQGKTWTRIMKRRPDGTGCRLPTCFAVAGV